MQRAILKIKEGLAYLSLDLISKIFGENVALKIFSLHFKESLQTKIIIVLSFKISVQRADKRPGCDKQFWTLKG
jgi:hypothetical protein